MQQVAVAANGDHRVAAGVEGTVGSVLNAAGTGVATGAANTTWRKTKKDEGTLPRRKRVKMVARRSLQPDHGHQCVGTPQLTSPHHAQPPADPVRRKTGLVESKERERLSKEKPAPQTTTKAVCAPKSAASALIATKEESSSSYESSSSSEKEAGKDEKPESPEADTTQQSEPAKKKPQDKKEKDHVGKPQQAAAKAGNASAPPATASASAADNYEKHEQLVNSLLKTAITEGLKSLR